MPDQQLKRLKFEGNQITFDLENGILLVNANEMSRKFNKEPKDFLRSKKIKEYISVFSQSANLPTDEIVKVNLGGSNPGTWFHQKLALRFAQWLSPEFSLWVDTQIEKLLTVRKPEPKTRQALSVYRDIVYMSAYCFVVRVDIYTSGRREYRITGLNNPGNYKPDLQDLLISQDLLQSKIYEMST